jgi:hypothetical protein
MTPKVFISYSWTSPGHQATIKRWAEQLLADGVDVVLDVFDLKEGADKYHYMEKMVTDPTITHVLVFSDKAYASKADARKAGVGTESQIISKEVYDKVAQSKFLPIACELDDNGEPYLPTFFKSRIFIDFSTPETANKNWEQLIRVLHGKPLHVKPALGKPPAYLRDEAAPASPAISKFNVLKQAILQSKPGLAAYRRDFLDACIQYADSLRIRQQPDTTMPALAQRTLADSGKLKLVRNHIVDWVLLEAQFTSSKEFVEALIDLLERLRALKGRPPELTSYNERWFEAHDVFVYETFLYIVAALMKTGNFNALHEIFTSHYLLPPDQRYGDTRFDGFETFYGWSELLNSVLAPEGKKLLAPAAELIKRQADREDLPFNSVIEAEVLVLMMAFIKDVRWYPQTLLYGRGSGGFPFFVRATQHKHFEKLAIVTGISDAEKLRAIITEARRREKLEQSEPFLFRDVSFSEAMNLSKLDTLK